MSWQNFKKGFDSVSKNLFLLCLGSFICASSINGILIPNHFAAGGITGLSLILHYQFPLLSFPLFYLLFNIPLFAIAWKYVGKNFFIYSLIGFCIFTLVVKNFHINIPLEDKMLSALTAGILSGAGLGVIFHSLGSSGGTDILSVVLMKKFSIRLGTTAFALNASVVAFSAILYPIETVLYTLIFIYVNAKVLNLVFTGMSKRKAVMIISENWSKISETLLKEFQRGLTIIDGEGAYSHKTEKILYAVIAMKDLGRIKEIVNEVDPTSFVVVTDTLEVVNPCIGNQPHW